MKHPAVRNSAEWPMWRNPLKAEPNIWSIQRTAVSQTLYKSTKAAGCVKLIINQRIKRFLAEWDLQVFAWCLAWIYFSSY